MIKPPGSVDQSISLDIGVRNQNNASVFSVEIFVFEEIARFYPHFGISPNLVFLISPSIFISGVNIHQAQPITIKFIKDSGSPLRNISL